MSINNPNSGTPRKYVDAKLKEKADRVGGIVFYANDFGSMQIRNITIRSYEPKDDEGMDGDVWITDKVGDRPPSYVSNVYVESYTSFNELCDHLVRCPHDRTIVHGTFYSDQYTDWITLDCTVDDSDAKNQYASLTGRIEVVSPGGYSASVHYYEGAIINKVLQGSGEEYQMSLLPIRTSDTESDIVEYTSLNTRSVYVTVIRMAEDL